MHTKLPETLRRPRPKLCISSGKERNHENLPVYHQAREFPSLYKESGNFDRHEKGADQPEYF